LGMRLNFNALWRQASARKIAMYALLLHTALFFTRTTQHRNIVFENSPQNCENVCEYKTLCVCYCYLFAHQLQVVEYRPVCCVRPSIVKSTNPLWLHISIRYGCTFLYSWIIRLCLWYGPRVCDEIFQI